MITSEIRVDGMFCEACVASVERVLTRIDGVEAVSVSLLHHKATITYDGECVDLTRIREAILNAGFEVPKN